MSSFVMSFLKIDDPKKRDAIVADFIEDLDWKVMEKR